MAAKIARPPAAASAAGVLSLLEEQENKLRELALERLNEVVDQFWPEIADYLIDIEGLYEDASFPGQQKAALVASKVYYHLEEYEDALRLALGAGKLFDLSVSSEYIDKIVSVGIDEYVRLQAENFEAEVKNKDKKEIDARLEDLVLRMFDRCMQNKTFTLGLGMAIECRRLDKVKQFIVQSDNVSAMLEYCQKSALTVVVSKLFRERIIDVLIEIHINVPEEECKYEALCQCYFHLNRPAEVADILKKLITSPEKEKRLLAYQIGFDLIDNENQNFCQTLLQSAQLKPWEPPAPPAVEAAPMQVDAGEGGAAETPAEGAAPAAAPEAAEPAPAPAAAAPADEASEEEREHLKTLRSILNGREAIDLHLHFLHRNNHSDLLLLETIKGSVDQRNSITHNATVIAHGLMQCGTTSDVFLRNNLEWLAKAHTWAKFTATASLGVIHKGNIAQSKSILSTYLPQAGGQAGSPYSEGGALYAMGLIHSHHHDAETKAYLLQQLHAAQSSEVLQHGACLGLGLVCMGTADDAIYDELKQTLFTDTAVAGEAAAYSIGLVMVGSAKADAISELLAYAHDTQHEKIIRACSLALAMMMFKKEEQAETLIQQMYMDKDSILRYGACFCIAMAYVGTGQNAAIRRLLHISVSDVSDDVRRAAVMALGFVLCNLPDQVPGVVKLLSESYNPHVRYAAAIALGIACAGSASLEAHNLLMPLVSDASDFVRQGAIISLGLIYMQTAPGMTERVKEFRTLLAKIIRDKHEDVITRFGAIVANGILDAGGRNCSVTMFSKSGVLRSGAAIGFCLFTQMWYWFPLIHMFSLTLTPTALIGLNDKLKIPKNFSFLSKAKPSLYAYPEPMKPPKKEEQARSATAVLSTAAKAKALKEKKDKEGEVKKGSVDVDMDDKASAASAVGVEGASTKGEGADTMSIAATQGTTIAGSAADSVAPSDLASDMMDVEDPEAKAEKPEAGEGAGKKEEEKADSKKEEEKPDKAPEPTEETLNNPCRVLHAQVPHISFDVPRGADEAEKRYVPLLGNRKSGFVILRDLRPEEPEELIQEEETPAVEEEKEPDPPEPFEWP